MIREATKEDVTCIAEMALIMWESNLEELAEEFEMALENEECVIYLYCVDNMPIGFAQCGLRHDYVEGTESSPVGYAGDLLTKCEKWVKQKGCSEFASDCELNNNVSLAFHMNTGFKEANRIICFTKRI